MQLTYSKLQQVVRLGSSGFKRHIQTQMVTHTPVSCRPSRWIGQLCLWQIKSSGQHAAEMMTVF